MNFFKTLLASLLGTMIGLFLLIMIFIIAIMSSSGEAEPHIRTNSILTINLIGDIPARTTHDPLRELFPATGSGVSLEMLRDNLEKAAADERIEGVWLKMNHLTASWANLETAYRYLDEFREQSGKFIYTSTDDLGMNETSYFLASLSDSIYSPPETFFEFNGFVIQTSYYRDMLERIGIEPEIMRVGEYKSAVEPFLREDSSPEHREQVMAILESVSATFISAVERRTGMSPQQIHELMNEIPENSVERAYQTGLIDGIAYIHDVENALKRQVGIDEEDELRTVSITRYNRISRSAAGIDEPRSNNKIAVIYASGMIIPQAAIGSPLDSENIITAEGIRSSLNSSLNDDDVKAIILHINSGGGAVSTSELIWSHIREASAQKPVIAYMGNVAASGGYYIAMSADTVMASPNTITGSIGIYNLLFNAQNLFNEKLGIHFEEFKTHEHADIMLMNRPLTSSEREAMQRSIHNGYETFLARVAQGRNMDRDEVDQLARGRVWTGRDALDANLVDLLGSLDDALEVAAEKAEIVEYEVVTYPERRGLFDMLFTSASVRAEAWARSFIPYSNEIRTLEQLMEHKAGKNWAILPVEFTID